MSPEPGAPPPGVEPARAPEPAAPPAAPPPAIDPAMAAFGGALARLTPNAAVVYVLLALNVGVYAVMLAQGVHWHEPKSEDLFRWGANFGPLTLGGEWWRLLSCAFVHAGILHLLLNMFSLWAVGRVVVRLLGTAGFTSLYLASALGGSLASIVWNPWSLSVGASGALFGVFGALAGYALRLRAVAPRAFLQSVVRDVAMVLVINLIYSFTAQGIDVAAHVGGLLVGFATALFLAMPPEPPRRQHRLVRALVLLTVSAGAAAAAVALVPSSAKATLAILESVDKDEARVLGAYNDAVRKVRDGALTEAAFADVIEAQVLPPWRAMGTRLGQLVEAELPERLRTRTSALRRYVAMREEAWVGLAAALRQADGAGVKAAMQKSREAEAGLKAALGGEGAKP